MSTFLSSVATCLQHLHMECSYHNSYVMHELAVNTQTFCIALNFLQLGFWNRVMLLQYWSHHYSFMIVIINSWIVTMYRSAPWKLISMCHSFHFLFRLPWTWVFLWATRWVFLESLHYRVAHLLLLQYILVVLMLFVVCLFSIFDHYLWIKVYWFPLESWFPWFVLVLTKLFFLYKVHLTILIE